MKTLMMTAAVGAMVLVAGAGHVQAQNNDGYNGLFAPNMVVEDKALPERVQMPGADGTTRPVAQPDINVAGPDRGQRTISAEEARRMRAEAQKRNVQRPTMAEDTPYRPLGVEDIAPRERVELPTQVMPRPDGTAYDNGKVATTVEERRLQSTAERQARIERLNQLQQQSREERAAYARDQFSNGATASGQEMPVAQRFNYNNPQRENLLKAYKARRVQDMEKAQDRYQTLLQNTRR